MLEIPAVTLVSGIIVDVIPHLGCYEVMTAGRRRMASLISHTTGISPTLGIHSLATIPVGTPVLLAVLPGDAQTFAVILGALPGRVMHIEGIAPGAIGHAPVGQRHDAINSLLLQDKTKTAWGCYNFSGGRPWDVLAGDWGYITPLGGGIEISQSMSFLRASEICGIWAFYLDNLLRIHGHRLEQFTAVSEEFRGDDEGELYTLDMRAKYPWEALGLLKSSTAAFNSNDKPMDATDDKAYGRWEPKHQDQTGIWRHQRIGGFLGDVEREYVAIPHPDFESDPAKLSDKKTRYAGVLEVAKHADGFYSVRSAKGMVFAKTALIPVPQQLCTPDNAIGDNQDNYTPPAPPEEFDRGNDDYGARGAGMLEGLAYRFNRQGVSNPAGHTKDWKVPEESDLAAINKCSRVTIDPSKLQAIRDKFSADKPKNVDVDVDEQHKKTKFMESFAALSFEDDGSVILEDAWGSQIILSQGNIEFSAAGNIVMRPGKSLISWAPGDTILRSGKHVEITSTKHDVRIKAEKNLHVLGGNGGTGGVLVEARSTSSSFQDGQGEEMNTSGIVLLSKKSAVSTWGSEVYLGIHRQATGPGKISIDAKAGEGTVYITAKQEYHRVFGPIVHHYADKDLTDIHHAGSTVLNGNVFLLGKVFVLTNGDTIGDIYVQGRCMAGRTVHGGGDDGQVMVFPSGDLESRLASSSTQITSYTKTYDATIQQEDDRIHQGDSALGAEALHARVGFSMRTDAQYKKLYDGLTLGQARWQQYLQSGLTWTETPVEAPTGGDTYPHPGKGIWTGNNFLKVKEHNFNTQSGLSTARGTDGSGYQAKLETEKVAFDGVYPVAVSI
jgi:hypothetical protein